MELSFEIHAPQHLFYREPGMAQAVGKWFGWFDTCFNDEVGDKMKNWS